MKNTLVSSTFFSLACCLGLQQPASGGEDPVVLPPVHISATRISPDFATPGRTVVVLDRDEIAARAAPSIAALLAGLPGVQIRTRGPFGVQTDLEMSGSSFEQVLVLVDGMRVNDPQTGHHNLNLPLAPEDLERIEIVYGAGSAVHGPDAFGGVVNLVPRASAAPRLDLATRWGKALDDSRTAAVGSEGALRYGWKGAWGTAWISAGRQRSDGYRDVTDFNQDRLFAHLRLPAAGGHLKLQAGMEDKAFGANEFYVKGRPSKEWTQAWLYSAQYQRPLNRGNSLSGRAYYRRHRDRFILTVDNPALYENRHLSHSSALESHLNLSLGAKGRLVAGGETARRSIDSNNLGQHARYRHALFAEYSGLYRPWTLQAGGRLDLGDDRLDLSPALSLSYRRSTARLYASVGRAFRAPSFTEFYYRDPGNIGNADLATEGAWWYELGTELAPLPYLHVKTAAFVRDEENLVDYIKDEADAPWEAQNLVEVRTTGAQIHIKTTAWKRVHPSFSYTWLDKERTLAPELLSKYVFTHPRHHLILNLAHPLVAGLRAHWQGAVKGRELGDDYALFSLVLSRRLPYGRALVRVDNLTDETYEEIPGVPLPGRWFSIETQFDL